MTLMIVEIINESTNCFNSTSINYACYLNVQKRFPFTCLHQATDRRIINGNNDITYPHFQMLDMPPVQPDQKFFLDSPCKEQNAAIRLLHTIMGNKSVFSINTHIATVLNSITCT